MVVLFKHFAFLFFKIFTTSGTAVRYLTASSNYTSNNPPRMQNQRLLVQF